MARTKATATEAERRSIARKAKQSKTKYKNVEEPVETVPSNPIDMGDKQLFQALRALGATVGPVNDGTRAVYQRRLGKLMKEKGLTNIEEIGYGGEQEESRVEEEETKTNKGRRKEDENEKMASSKKKKRVLELRKVIEENEDETEEEIVKPDVKSRGRKKTVDNEEGIKVDAQIEKQIEEEEIKKMRKGRKTSDKKVSFAQVDTLERKGSDEEEKIEKVPVQLRTKKREPSVQIVDGRKNDINETEKEVIRMRNRSIRGMGHVDKTIVIEEENEDEINVVKSIHGNEEESDNDESMHNSSILNRFSTRIERGAMEEEDEDNEEQEEREDENEKEDDSNSTIHFELEDVGNDPIPGEDEEYEEEREIEDSPQRIPMKSRPRLLSVESPAVNIIRRSRLNREISMRSKWEEDEIGDGRRMTIDMFNTKSPNHSTDEKNIDAQPLPRKISLILEESDDMDVSSGDKRDKIAVDQTTDNYSLDDSDDMEITNGSRGANNSTVRRLGNLSRRLFIDDSENMEISNRSRDGTLKLRQNASILIVDTPKSSRMKNEKNGSVYGPRNIRKMVGKSKDGNIFDVPCNIRSCSDMDLSFPLEDTFTEHGLKVNSVFRERSHLSQRIELRMSMKRRTRRMYLETSVGMATFNDGIDREGGDRMHSTRICEANSLNARTKTFVVKNAKKDENEYVNNATFVVPKKDKNTIGQREKSVRLTRNIVRSPSRSPARNPRRTYVISSSPSRLHPAQKSSIVPTPSRSRPPPKPMPRRIKPDVESEAPSISSSTSSFPSIPPVPAPRRIAPTVVGEMIKDVESRFDGRNGVNEKRDIDISPASLFNTQPRSRKMSETMDRELTPIDRMNIEKLRSLRERMKQRKEEGQTSFQLDMEARMIIEGSPYLKRYFY